MKTHEELGITLDEFVALVKVEDGLRTGNYQHIDEIIDYDGVDAGKFKILNMLFNMNVYGKQIDCGTAACIGGWVAHTMRGKKKFDIDHAENYIFREASNSLQELFYPPTNYDEFDDSDDMWNSITPKHAAKAIKKFLKTGKVDWSHVKAK